jgi:hypothetical protein
VCDIVYEVANAARHHLEWARKQAKDIPKNASLAFLQSVRLLTRIGIRVRQAVCTSYALFPGWSWSGSDVRIIDTCLGIHRRLPGRASEGKFQSFSAAARRILSG